MNKKAVDGIFIIHFQPLERFPPVINLLNYLGDTTDTPVVVISTSGKKGSPLKPYTGKWENITIKRTPCIIPGSFLRLFHYAAFYLYSLFLLIKVKPVSVLYFETLSSWPALMYKKLRGDKVKLLLHCHEYTSPENYNDMWLVKKMHTMEAKMYAHNYEWISHTNEVRLSQFRTDNNLNEADNRIFHTMPNYPSRSWKEYKTEFGSTTRTRLVFVGSLGYNNMYLQETVDWVSLNKDYLSLDIYAYNIDKKARDLLLNNGRDCVRYFGGINYKDLPQTLKNYDVGLVMYKPFSYNTVIAVSNKVFEYLACGLDVWFSEDMTYTHSYSRQNSYPKIIPLNFKRLNEFIFKSALNREGLNKADDNYFYENIYGAIYKSMVSIS